MTPEQRDKLMKIDASVSRGLLILGMTVVIGSTLLLIVSFAVAGFSGWLKPKREPTTNFYRPLPESDIPTWHLAYSNGFDGPFGVIKRESNRLTATYRIDYSINIGK